MGKTLVSTRFIALFFLVASLLSVTQGDLVDDTCKSSPIPNLCTSVLRSDPRSANADVKGLALIVVDAIEKQSSAALNEINKLRQTDPRDSLRKCAERYSLTLKANIPLAKAALARNNPKLAEKGVVDAGNEATVCEKAFAPAPSPLTAFNNAVRDLSVVCDAIVKLLL